jgi:hypothetical protein
MARLPASGGAVRTVRESTRQRSLYLVLVVVSCMMAAINIAHDLFHLRNVESASTMEMQMQTMKDSFKRPKGEIATKTASNHPLAGLSCEAYGGPSKQEQLDEIVYWSDIPSDAAYKSSFYDPSKYLLFEADHGGWNNIRMGMETVLAMAHAMGRTLVLPPEQSIYLLKKNDNKQKKSFTFNDFFHMADLAAEHEGLDIITTEEFLTREGMAGNLVNLKTNEVVKPPNVDYNGKGTVPLHKYLLQVAKVPHWVPDECLAAFPRSSDPADILRLQKMMDDINAADHAPTPLDYEGKPVGIMAPSIERLKENLANRKNLCIYDEELQNAKVVYFQMDHATKSRLLIHFYSFIFFDDWKQDLWTKRFVRDHVRYVDEVMCAAARIISAIREISTTNGNTNGEYDAYHIRRGDFQYKRTQVEAGIIYDKSKGEVREGATVYIATDEQDKVFFDPLAKHYKLLFLDDFIHLIPHLNTNFYGMLDQMICVKSRVFYGTWWSTFSGYINRMRGYHVAKNKWDGYQNGTLNSWYYPIPERWDEARTYRATRQPFYMTEFPTSWLNIDTGVDNLYDTHAK